ncbi:unnamed protein product [Rotaria magnacalcarata]|uniref:Sorting nexin-3 n=1 Tax=Rotaria magnacalcarata TaxID=392030 RepID=A0A816NKL1_9BILA|nr:unnamed protein product [Rotaria magnacalcarata]CAF2035934.1 unnamed protein product [Rotaria magnacalcarata]
MVTIIALIFFILTIRAHGSVAVEQHLPILSEQDYIITTVPMQSVTLPCKALSSNVEFERVMWYRLKNPGQSPLNVGQHLITKDSRFSVAYYSVDHGLSPAKWDLHITNVRLSDAAHYQCHVVAKDNRKSIRSNVKLIVEDIIVNIEPIDAFVFNGNKTKFACNFTGKHRVPSEKVIWLKDNKALVPDASHVITSIELSNVTVTTLEIIVSHYNDSGSYRCSDGHDAQMFIDDNSDFEWLHKELEQADTKIAVPSLPGKAWERQLSFRKDAGLFQDDFIEERRRGLETFINKIAAHPLAQNERVLHVFLLESEIDLSKYVRDKIKH